MNRLPDFQTDLLFSENPPAAAEAKAEPAAAAPVSTTTEPAPLSPQMNGVLPEPISGGQTFILVAFGVLAFVMLVAMTRYGRDNNYGD